MNQRVLRLSHVEQRFQARESSLLQENRTLQQHIRQFQEQNEILQHQIHELTASVNDSQSYMPSRLPSPHFILSPDKQYHAQKLAAVARNIVIDVPGEEEHLKQQQVIPNIISPVHRQSAGKLGAPSPLLLQDSRTENTRLDRTGSAGRDNASVKNSVVASTYASENLAREFSLILDRKKSINLPKQQQYQQTRSLIKTLQSPHLASEEQHLPLHENSLQSSQQGKTPGKIYSQTLQRDSQKNLPAGIFQNK